MSSPSSLTPMMEQYHRMKRGLPQDILLFFRLGDFYEMFFEDAREVSSILSLTLTRRNGIPMCGVPHHAAEGYIARLVRAGKRVAIAEQTTTPTAGKLVEREISRIISAGTLADLNLDDTQRNNFIVALFYERKQFGLACVDHSTGEFSLGVCPDLQGVRDELAKLNPSEILVSASQIDQFPDIAATCHYEHYAFSPGSADQMLRDHFGVMSLEGFGCAGMDAAVGAAGAILHYLTFQLRRDVSHIRQLRVRQPGAFVLIDAASQRNLDLVDTRGDAPHTLLKAMDRTATPMGSRKLRDWLLHPLREMQPLLERQQLLAALLGEEFLHGKIRSTLKEIRDLERITGRLSQGNGNARDLQSLASSLRLLPDLLADLESLPESGALGESVISRFATFDELVDLLDNALADELPVTIKEGGMLRDGFHAELDKLRLASRDGKNWLAELQEREKNRTGIDSLKIRYNNVFGYYIEVTKAKLDLVPDDYTRKQTLANAERFVTPELKEMENTILGADERARQLEYEEFCRLRERVCEYIEQLQTTSEALADLDVISGLADLARHHSYQRPTLEETRRLEIIDGRHPVIEQIQTSTPFVPNDVMFEPESNRVLLITGPNMAGKSTYIRQVALITIMAQIGSFVPAAAATIGLVDRIFCRVGASDDLARGQSTFMVEMSETALILNNATAHSLVILDEIGRGTATFDGLSIAWSVAEFLHDDVGARTLFATHYHELTDLAESRPAVRNYNVAVKEWNEEIIFLRKILPGCADQSYGIQVARLAGLPRKIIERAREILTHLEMNSSRPGTHEGRMSFARINTTRDRHFNDASAAPDSAGEATTASNAPGCEPESAGTPPILEETPEAEEPAPPKRRGRKPRGANLKAETTPPADQPTGEQSATPPSGESSYIQLELF